jgi:hypothetical protein
MNKKLFTILDTKVGAYLAPFILRNKAEAFRGIMECMKQPDHGFAQYPEDYTLFEIGEWDENTGTIIPYEAKISITNLLDLKTAEKPKQTRLVSVEKTGREGNLESNSF